MASQGTLPGRGPAALADVPCGKTVRAVGPDTPPARPGGTFPALRHRNYRLFFFGQLVSVTGSWVQMTALMWLAFHLTGTSRWPALVAAVQLAPALLLGPWGGVLADRRPKRALLVQTQGALLVLAL